MQLSPPMSRVDVTIPAPGLPTNRDELDSAMLNVVGAFVLLAMKPTTAPTPSSVLAADIERFAPGLDALVGAARSIAPEHATTWDALVQANAGVHQIGASLRKGGEAIVGPDAFVARLEPSITVYVAALETLGITPPPGGMPPGLI